MRTKHCEWCKRVVVKTTKTDGGVVCESCRKWDRERLEARRLVRRT